MKDSIVLVDSKNEAPAWLKIARLQVESVRFGTVQVVIHDGRVVQIEKTEKIRLENSGIAER